MSTEVKPVPNVPPALRTLVHEAVGAASVCWKDVEDERIFDTEKALDVAADLVAHIERAFDAREKPLFAHLSNLAFHLGYWEHDSTTGHASQARRALENIRTMLEQPR